MAVPVPSLGWLAAYASACFAASFQARSEDKDLASESDRGPREPLAELATPRSPSRAYLARHCQPTFSDEFRSFLAVTAGNAPT